MQEKNLGGRPSSFQDFEEFEKKVDEYFDEAKANEEPYSVSGLALYLGCHRQTLDNYQMHEDTRYFDTIKKAKDKVLLSLEINALKSGYHPIVAIFLMKAMHGLKETSVVENEHRGDGVSITFTKNESKNK